jgi:hypothetical protein
LESRDGQKYVGEFRNDYFDGKGTLVMPPVGTYKGDFRNGRYDGAGTLFLLTGTSVTGQFRGGLLDGPCTLKLKDGVVVKGGFRYGVPMACGRARKPTGRRRSGNSRTDFARRSIRP